MHVASGVLYDISSSHCYLVHMCMGLCLIIYILMWGKNLGTPESIFNLVPSHLFGCSAAPGAYVKAPTRVPLYIATITMISLSTVDTFA